MPGLKQLTGAHLRRYQHQQLSQHLFGGLQDQQSICGLFLSQADSGEGEGTKGWRGGQAEAGVKGRPEG